MIVTIPFQLEHMQKFQAIEWDCVGVDKAFLREASFNYGAGLTIISEGRIVACYGIVPTHTRGFVWAAFANDITSFEIRTVIRSMKNWCETVLEHGFTRLEAAVRIDFPKGGRFLDSLGFTKEATMKCYLQDNDYDLYARVA